MSDDKDSSENESENEVDLASASTDLDLDLSDGPTPATRIDASSEPVAAVTRTGLGIGGRLAGLVAFVLGLLGCVLALALLAVSVRLVFSASGIADTAAAPLNNAVTRLETRIDQADDLVDRDGVSGAQMSELRARADGLADSAAAVEQSFAAIDNHVLYRWLPIDKDALSGRLDQFSVGSSEITSTMASAGSGLSATAAESAGERINSMQTAVSSVDDLIDSTVDSLTSWIRVAGLAGLLLSLWNLWAQISLLKRGWRGLRGR